MAYLCISRSCRVKALSLALFASRGMVGDTVDVGGEPKLYQSGQIRSSQQTSEITNMDHNERIAKKYGTDGGGSKRRKETRKEPSSIPDGPRPKKTQVILRFTGALVTSFNPTVALCSAPRLGHAVFCRAAFKRHVNRSLNSSIVVVLAHGGVPAYRNGALLRNAMPNKSSLPRVYITPVSGVICCCDDIGDRRTKTLQTQARLGHSHPRKTDGFGI